MSDLPIIEIDADEENADWVKQKKDTPDVIDTAPPCKSPEEVAAELRLAQLSSATPAEGGEES